MLEERVDSPPDLLGKLRAIEHDLEERQGDIENAVRRLSILKRKWEYINLTTYLRTTGTVREREAHTLVAVVAANAELYEDLKEVEAQVAAINAVVRVAAERASILQSQLRAIREYGA